MSHICARSSNQIYIYIYENKDPTKQILVESLTCYILFSCDDTKWKNNSSFHASGTPGRHQWLQSWTLDAVKPTAFRPYTDGWPSILIPDRLVMFRIVTGVFICFVTCSRITFLSGTGLACVSLRGTVLSLQCPPEFHSPPLKLTTNCCIDLLAQRRLQQLWNCLC
jgi:hypothetical protein